MHLYVNPGLGTMGVPFRFLCRPEVTLHTLVPA
jgi:predicted MPP superfamily phosphohydrolase